jgi:hypothetical protein
LGTFDDGGGNYACPQHMRVIQYFFKLPIWMWDAVSGGLQPQP